MLFFYFYHFFKNFYNVNFAFCRVGKTVKFTIKEDLGRDQDHAIKETVKEEVLKGKSVVLNLDKDHSKLFIGGYPPHFNIQQAVKYASFEGQMEEFVIGDDKISLWNFADSSNIIQGSKER